MNDSKIEMLEQPLTVDGEINPLCIAELNHAIKNMGTVADRSRNDPEWNTKRWYSKKDITGAFACAAVRCSPYRFPENLEKLTGFLDAALDTAFKWESVLTFQSLCDICDALYKVLYDLELFKAWNQRKREPTDEERDLTDSKRDPDTDFIDLDALLTNVCIQLRNEMREWDRFNADFEAGYGTQTK